VPEAIVIGAGIGGLSSALILASRGWNVTIYEASPTPGGKAGTATVDGVTFDTGPSVLTLPEVFDGVFAHAGTRLADIVQLREPTPAFRYRWSDGAQVDLQPGLDGTLAAVRDAFGASAEAELAAYLAHARRIWDGGGQRFVFGPPPGWHLLTPRNLLTLFAIDPLRTLAQSIDAYIHEPHLRMLLARYATYNGSDPRKTPATLGCIAHVELALGGYGIQGGVAALIAALVATCRRLGVDLRYGAPVHRVVTVNNQVTGVDTDDGFVPCPYVIGNADARKLLTDLGQPPKGTPSTSGWTAVVRAGRRPRAANAVMFPPNYDEEFVDMFDRDRPPADPTVYACAQGVAHGLAGWDDAEPVFLMANAPAEAAPSPPETWEILKARVIARAIAAGFIGADDPVVWERTPTQLAAQFPGTGGAIYGLASNDRWAAFRRPPNRTNIRGLYLASGSAHPGGGMPLCAYSGRLAAEAVMEDAR
jgi:phytoene desaturase